MHTATRDHLRRLVEQIERLEQEKKDIAADIGDRFKEAKSAGFDVKILRHVLRLRKQDASEREEAEALIATYMTALEGTPLGKWADARDGALQ